GGQPLNGIAVVYARHWQAAVIKKSLTCVGIPCAWVRGKSEKKAYDSSAEMVALLTRQSSKGLEFDTVVLAGLGGLREEIDRRGHEVRLLYIGMTRARQRLLVVSSDHNWFTNKLHRGSASTL
ncbi:MAG: 3'-5' exonuclease, partial [Pseudomonadales bacterium]